MDLSNSFEYRLSKVRSASLFGADSTDNFRAIIEGLLTVEGALFAGESLADDFRVWVDDKIFPRLCVVESHLRSHQITASDWKNEEKKQ